MPTEIKLKAVNHYGHWVYYPDCDKSRVFAQIAGTKTLTAHVIYHIKALGYVVDISTESPPL
jgi:hypothetical protein